MNNNGYGKVGSLTNKFSDATSYLGYVFGFSIIGGLLVGFGPMIPLFGIAAIIIGCLALVCAGIAQLICIVKLIEGMGDLFETNRSSNAILLQQLELIKKNNQMFTEFRSEIYSRLYDLIENDAEIKNNAASMNQLLTKSQQYICDGIADLVDNTK